MLPEQLTILDDFPPVSYEQWRAVVDADLNGASFEQTLVSRSYDGFDIQPIYTQADAPPGEDPHGLPGLPPFVRGATPLGAAHDNWDLRQEYGHPDLGVANQSILADLEGGATSVQLRLDAAARAATAPGDAPANGRDGLLAFGLADLDAVLAGVHLDMVGVGLDAGAAFLPAAAQLFALWRQRGVPADTARGALNGDPLGVLAAEGALPYPIESGLEQLINLARDTAQQWPCVTAIGVCSTPYHNAGATAAQDIAFSVASAVEYLRAAVAAGMSVDDAARQMLFRMDVGTHHFLAIAKLRAARRVWSRVIEASGGSPDAAAMQLHARTSDRVLTRRDPHVNLLRNTVAVFAASIGGAQTITPACFDRLVGLPTDHSRRIARNTVLILQEEAHLNRVLDPAGGSWFLDNLTDQLAECAWGVLQDIERQGGQLAALRSGWVAQQIDSAYAARADDIARRKHGITGVSEFADVAEPPLQTATADVGALRAAAAQRVAAAGGAPAPECSSVGALTEAAARGATTQQLAAAIGFRTAVEEVAPLMARSSAEPFEQLRDASDAWLAQHGSRPRVFLANLGPPAHHTARATYSKNFFEAGGFEVISNDGFNNVDDAAAAFKKSGARIAVVCSSDKRYPEYASGAAAKLKQAGARTVVLAGLPGDNESAWRGAGVDRFIYSKCDVLSTLRDLLAEEGVLAQ